MNYYSKIPFRVNKSISPTDTLLSKILLGTLGCVPAFDRYFIAGLKEMGRNSFAFDNPSLEDLFVFIDCNKEEIGCLQKMIAKATNKYYPKMKIVDMFFWQIGYDKAKQKGDLYSAH